MLCIPRMKDFASEHYVDVLSTKSYGGSMTISPTAHFRAKVSVQGGLKIKMSLI